MQISSPPAQFNNPELDMWLRELYNNLINVIDSKVTLVDVPASSASSGTKGQVAMDSNYLYICYADNNWKRLSFTTIWGFTGVF